jgi:hypothetical protein
MLLAASAHFGQEWIRAGMVRPHVNLSDITLLRHEAIVPFVLTVVTIFSRVTRSGEAEGTVERSVKGSEPLTERSMRELIPLLHTISMPRFQLR